MRKKLLIVPVLMLLILLGAALPVFAAEKWAKPEDNPSPYARREYTRQHWTRFWVSETGYGKNYWEGGELIGQGYCSVFDLPGSLASGYTAVMEKDTDIGLSAVRQKFLQAFDFHYDNATKGYPCIPAWYKENKENGYENAGLYMSDKSGCQ